MASISSVITNLRLFKSKWVAMIAFYSVVNVGFASAASLIYGDTVDGFQNLPRASMQIIAASLGSLPYKQMFATSPRLTTLFIFVYQILIYTVFVRSFLLIFMASCGEYTSFFEKSQSSTAGIIDKSLKRIARSFSDSNNIVFRRISIGIRYLRELLSADNMGKDTNMKASGDELVAAQVSQKIRSLASRMDQDIITLTLSEGNRFGANQTFQTLMDQVQKATSAKRKTQATNKSAEEGINRHSAPTWTENFIQQVQTTHIDFAERLRKSVIHRTSQHLQTYFIRDKALKALEDFYNSQDFAGDVSALELFEHAARHLPQAFKQISNVRRATVNQQFAREKTLLVSPTHQPAAAEDEEPQPEFELEDYNRGPSLVQEKFSMSKSELQSDLVQQITLWLWAVLASTAASTRIKKKVFRSGSRSSQGSPTKSKTKLLTGVEKVLEPLKTLPVSEVLHGINLDNLAPLRRFWLRLDPQLKQDIWCAGGELELSLSARMMILAAVGYSIHIEDYEMDKEGNTEMQNRVERNATNKSSFEGKKVVKDRTRTLSSSLQGLAQFSNIADLTDYLTSEGKLGSSKTLKQFESYILKQQELLPEELKYTFLLQLNNQTGSKWRHNIYSSLLPTNPVRAVGTTRRQSEAQTVPKTDSEILLTEALYCLAPKSAFWLRLGSIPADCEARYSYIQSKLLFMQPIRTSHEWSTCTC